jgi:single-stranded-DNA-specific exonuclease
LVALGTVCDVMPLTDLNRAFVAQGLKVMAAGGNAGLRALSDVAGLNEAPDAYHLGFILGPRVNAGGRVGEAALGARLLASDDPAACRAMAAQLDAFNAERQGIEAEVLAQAEAQLAEEGVPESLLMLTGRGWHPGVIGIVAGRLKERYNRPSFVLGLEEAGIAKGSGRSVPGVDLGAAVLAARQAGLLINGGGHPMAAGITVEAEALPALKAFLSERIDQSMTAAGFRPTLTLDGALSPGGASRDLLEMLERLAPYGSANPRPRFVLPQVRIVDPRVVGGRHVSCWLASQDGKRVRAIAFRALDVDGVPSAGTLGSGLLQHGCMPWHVAGSLKRDDWNGRNGVQFVIDDLAPAG